MKKFLFVLLGALGFMSFTACNALPGQNDVLATNSEIYAFSAISSASLLGNTQTATPVVKTLSDTEETLIEQEVEDINKYLNMIEQFLGSNNGFSIESQTSDRVEYANKIVFTSVDLLGNQVVHILYYNEVLATETAMVDDLEEEITEEDTEVDTEDETEVEDEEEDESEFEDQETTLSGILVMNDLEYSVTGKKEIEDNEEKIEIVSAIDSLNYVKVVSKLEDNERKYFYEVVEEGVVTTSSKLKIEEEDNETKVNLEYVQGTTSGSFEFKRELEDGEDIIKIQYEINDGVTVEQGEVKILVITDPLTGDTTYQYKVKTDDNVEIEIEEEREDEDDVEDEDDEIEDTSL